MSLYGTRPITKTTQIAYAIPAFALAFIGIPIYVYLPKFYTDIVGVDISLVGFLLLGVRVFDAVTDPLIGHFSDRATFRLGRRRPFMAVGAVGLAISVYFLFNPESNLTTMEAAIWFACGLFCLFFFWTIITVPYESLGAEITYDYHERTSLFSMRDGFLIFGTLFAAASPKLADMALALLSIPVNEKKTFFVISIVYSPMIILGCAFCIWKIKERTVISAPLRPNSLEGFKGLLHNRPFHILLIAYTISAFGASLPATLILYYVAYVLGSSNAELFLMLYFTTGIACLPMWIRVSRKIGKKKAWLISMLINTGAFFGVFFLGQGDALPYGILVCISGIGFGAGLALPSAIQADVIDYDEMLTGQRNEGRYIGLWSISKKLSAALGIGIALSMMGSAGYDPNTLQNDQVLWTIKFLYALVPCVCNIIAMCVLLFYPITEKRHLYILNQISKKDPYPPSLHS